MAGQDDRLATPEQLARPFFSTEEIAERLGRSRYAVYRSLHRGDTGSLPPHLKVGDRWFFPRSLFDAWVADIEARALAACVQRRGPGRPRNVVPATTNREVAR